MLEIIFNSPEDGSDIVEILLFAGAAAHQWTTFKYSVCSPTLEPNCQYFPVKPVSQHVKAS